MGKIRVFKDLYVNVDLMDSDWVSNGFDVRDAKTLTLSVEHVSGVCETNEIVLQFALKNEDLAFHDTEYIITGTGIIYEIPITSIEFVRVKIKTVDNGICNISIAKAVEAKFC